MNLRPTRLIPLVVVAAMSAAFVPAVAQGSPIDDARRSPATPS